MGRSPCCDKSHTNKGTWTREEDQRLIAYIKAHGEGCWRQIPKAAGLLRCGKSCRLRWINYLRPDLKRGNFTNEEDNFIIKLHSLLGNKWSLIAARLPGRTDNEIKNYWNSHLRRKLLSRGIDPLTHKPINTDTDKGEKFMDGFGCKIEKNPVEKSLTELNLELRIGPPNQHPPLPLERKEKKVCFYCSLGLENSKYCTCGSSSNSTNDF
ncbi:myb-related protein 308-like [Quercus lobata]|uniref:Uncharacterized protein n=1 Tax=Quercus lobata TaxID=97700 RepID=A0A7N2M2K7_QUELO|nr:myb-related protein 308-like [Quercus lobata]